MSTILIVEDDSYYVSVAMKAFSMQHRTKLLFASTYEEAMEFLESTEIDVVISDLFFPSKIDWRRQLLEKLETIPGKEEFERPSGSVRENPSGLAIAKWCHENSKKFIMISQGDRHEGDFATVRDILLYKNFITGNRDPLPEIMVNDGLKIDKSRKETWTRSLHEAQLF